MTAKLITIITSERSGSNFFCDFLENAFPSINSNTEIFNIDKAYFNKKTLEFISDKYNLTINESDDFETTALSIRQQLKLRSTSKLQIIKDICKIKGYDFCSVKIFVHHLTNDELNEIVKMSSICIFLHRNPVDRYISYIKACNTQVWHTVDQTNIQIEFKTNRYLLRENIYSNFKKEVLKICNNSKIPCEHIYYENICNLPIDKLQKYVHEKIFKKIFPEINMVLQEEKNIVIMFKKQDFEKSLFKKIVNYKEVEIFIKKENDTYVKIHAE